MTKNWKKRYSQSWRNLAPTPKQIALLETKGLYNFPMTRGDCSDAIAFLLGKESKPQKRMKKRKRIPLLSDEEL